jgi:hypothetical protein
MAVPLVKSVKLANLDRSRGDSVPIEFILYEDRGLTEAIDLTGDTFLLSVSSEEYPTTASYEFQSIGAVATPFSGLVSFPVSESNADRTGDYYYDVQRITGGLKRTIIKGIITFNQDITKD